jgi:hypothetical protein
MQVFLWGNVVNPHIRRCLNFLFSEPLAKETVCIAAVIPAKAGIQCLRTVAIRLDPAFAGVTTFTGVSS